MDTSNHLFKSIKRGGLPGPYKRATDHAAASPMRILSWNSKGFRAASQEYERTVSLVNSFRIWQPGFIAISSNVTEAGVTVSLEWEQYFRCLELGPFQTGWELGHAGPRRRAKNISFVCQEILINACQVRLVSQFLFYGWLTVESVLSSARSHSPKRLSPVKCYCTFGEPTR